jgi:hypothetical protein
MFPQEANPPDFTFPVPLESQGCSHNNGVVALSTHQVGVFTQEMDDADRGEALASV